VKQLLILRHAKSDWADPGLNDFERPLNPRGEHDAPRMGAWLAGQRLQPDSIVSSPALRTVQTTRLLAAAAGVPEALIRFEAGIYEAHVSTLVQLLRGFDDSWQRPLLVGHNPGMHDLVERLGGERIHKYPTCALTVLELQIENWNDIRQGQARLLQMMTPKNLPEE